jgi:hypothetical protein
MLFMIGLRLGVENGSRAKAGHGRTVRVSGESLAWLPQIFARRLGLPGSGSTSETGLGATNLGHAGRRGTEPPEPPESAKRRAGTPDNERVARLLSRRQRPGCDQQCGAH